MGKIIRIDTLHQGDRRECTANFRGFRIVVWFLGCDIRCKGCHNQQYWDFDDPKFPDFSKEHISAVIGEMGKYRDIYSGLSVLGGEPFSTRNVSDAVELCERFKDEFPEKDICIWSGHTLGWLQSQTGEYGGKVARLLGLCDFLVDGEFIQDKRNISLKFRGSPNQVIWEKDEENNFVRSKLNDV